MYKAFDTYPVELLDKQREDCFSYGTKNDGVPQIIVDARDTHKRNADALEQSLKVFSDHKDKRRLPSQLNERLLQERKWVKHYEACLNEHKKGQQVAELTKQLEREKTQREEDTRKWAKWYDSHQEVVKRKTELERQLVQFKKLKEKKEDKKPEEKKDDKPKKKKSWWRKFLDWFKPQKKEKKAKEKTTDAKMVAKELAPPKMSKKQRRNFYMARQAEREKNDTE